MATIKQKLNPDHGKCRVACALIYPESAPKDWLQKLKDRHIPACISPLHDHDTYDSDKYRYYDSFEYDFNADDYLQKGKEWLETLPVDARVSHMDDGYYAEVIEHHKGDVKKPHYHIMIVWGNSTTHKSFMKVFNEIGAVVPPWDHMEVISVMAMHRYFVHLDDPNKYQYNPMDIIYLGGFDPSLYLTYAEKNAPFSDIIKYIKKHSDYISSYADLLDMLLDDDSKLFNFACNHTLALEPYLKTRRK